MRAGRLWAELGNGREVGREAGGQGDRCRECAMWGDHLGDMGARDPTSSLIPGQTSSPLWASISPCVRQEIEEASVWKVSQASPHSVRRGEA